MTLLAGIMGARVATNTVDNSEFAKAVGDTALAGVATCNNAIDQAASRLDRLMGAAEAIEVINPQSADARVMARMHLATAMADCEIDDGEAAELTSGLESDTVVAGIEAWSSIKDFVKSIIEFIQKQWRKLKAFVAKYWNKYMGDVERLNKSWISVKEDAKKKQTGYTLEKNGKHTFERSAEQFYVDGKLLKGDALEEQAVRYGKVVDAYVKIVDACESLEFDESTILTSDGLLDDDMKGAGPKELKSDFGKTKLGFGTFTPARTDIASLKDGVSTSGPMAGNVEIVYCNDAASEDVVEVLKSTRIVIANRKKGSKVEKKAIISYVGAGDIEALADANIELLGSVVSLRRNKALAKASDELDKISKELDQWKKNAPSGASDTSAQQRSDFRQAVRIVTESFSLLRRLKINAPIDLCNQARIVSSAHIEYAKKSLSAMKKD